MIKMTDSTYYKALLGFDMIFVFGTSLLGVQEKECVERAGKTIRNYVVSKRTTDDTVNGIRVKSFDEMEDYEKTNGLIIIARAKHNESQTKKMLKEEGFKNIIVRQWSCEQLCCDSHQTNADNYYGVKVILDEENSESNSSVNLLVYAVTSHLNKHETVIGWHSKYIKYIQAGAAISRKRICDITDDIGINISSKNPSYNETTAGYWIANNDMQHDYVGLYHYSRGIKLADRQLENVCKNNVDVVFQNPFEMNYEMLSSAGDGMLEAIKKATPEYIDAAEKYLLGHYFLQGNILIAKRNIFAEYYDWLYKVQCEMERINNPDKEKDARYIAHQSEHLMNVYFIKHAREHSVLFAPSLYIAW